MNVVNLQDEARQESAPFVVVMLLLGILGPTVFLGLPAIVGQVERHWGFGEAALGLSSFIEVLGESTGTLLVAFVLGRQPVRWVLAGAVRSRPARTSARSRRTGWSRIPRCSSSRASARAA